MTLHTGVPAIDDSTAPFVVGSDEVGYGAWAGPIAVAAVAVPRGWVGPKGLTDSKKMSTAQMERVHTAFLSESAVDPPTVFWCIYYAHAGEIDQDGAGPTLTRLHEKALTRATERARELAQGEAPLVIADGNVRVEGAIGLPKADNLIPAVSMASVIAKLARDDLMAAMAKVHPGYGFEKHVGYGTKQHQDALAALGPCPIHRRSYAPIAALLSKDDEPKEMWLLLDDD